MAKSMKHTSTAPCLMSPDVCGLSSVCPRTSTRRLLDATLRGAAAVAAAMTTTAASSGTNPPIAARSSSSLPQSTAITCCSNSDDSICTGSMCGSGDTIDEHGSCETTVVVSAVAAAASINASAASATFKCPRCPRAYALSYTLERHMKYECGVAKQFGCFKCGKRFSRKDILKAHISNTRLHCAAAVAAAAATAAATVTNSVASEDGRLSPAPSNSRTGDE